MTPVGSIGQNGRYDRFRSFAERYIIARAPEFTKGKELEEGWQAIQDAKKLYQMTANSSRDAEEAENAMPQMDPEIMTALQNIAEAASKAGFSPSPSLIRKLYLAAKGTKP